MVVVGDKDIGLMGLGGEDLEGVGEAESGLGTKLPGLDRGFVIGIPDG